MEDPSVLEGLAAALGSAQNAATLPSITDETEPQSPTPATEASGETEAAQAEAPNWEDASNPYKSRFQGLQGSVQQVTERARRLEAEKTALEERLLQQATMNMTPQQREATYLQVRAAQQAASQAEQLTQREAAVEMASRQLYVDALVKQYGVTPDSLAKFALPTEMKAHAEEIAAIRAQAQAQIQTTARRVTGQDNFGPVASHATPVKKQAASLEDAAAAFAADPRFHR